MNNYMRKRKGGLAGHRPCLLFMVCRALRVMGHGSKTWFSRFVSKASVLTLPDGIDGQMKQL